MTTSPPVLTADRLTKEYKLFATPGDRLKSLVLRQTRHQSHWALQDVSFELARGQCLGVIGDNGAGKSTLLKLIAGTLQPTWGKLTRTGRVTAILELGAGFHPEFSGRDNLYFGGSLIGIEAAQMAELEASIIEFAELAHAIDRPVKTYSSGMVVRLAFALVTAVRPDVLIVDEALAVGDQHFQKKCSERIREFRAAGCSILFCSHSLYHVRQLCDAALWLDQGRVRAYGETDSVISQYEQHVRAQEFSSTAQTSQTLPPPEAPAALTEGQRARMVSIRVAGLTDSTSAPDTIPTLTGPDLTLTVTVQALDPTGPSIGVMLEQLEGVGIDSVATHAEGVCPKKKPDGTWQVTLTFPRLPLHSGDYVLSAYLFDATGVVVYEEWPRFQTFRWHSPSLTPGLVKLAHQWT